MKMRTRAAQLMPGDVMVGTGEIVQAVQENIRTPKKKITVTLRGRGGRLRSVDWWRHTSVGIDREEAVR